MATAITEGIYIRPNPIPPITLKNKMKLERVRDWNRRKEDFMVVLSNRVVVSALNFGWKNPNSSLPIIFALE